MLQLRAAASDTDIAAARDLMHAYAASLPIDLGFQAFETELRTLPGAYARPAGRLVVAWLGDRPVACSALRPLSPTRCEMKRLYVDPQARGLGVGRLLASHIVAEAVAIGYSNIVLDVLPEFTAARRLYAGLGFRPTAPYCDNPVPGAEWLGLDLQHPT